MRGQVGGRLIIPREAIPPIPAQLSLVRDTSMAVAAGAETKIDWGRAQVDRFRTFNPLVPGTIRIPSGASWVRVTAFHVQWAAAPGTELFFRVTLLRPNTDRYFRMGVAANASGRCVTTPWLRCYGGETDLEFKVYHATTTSAMAYAQADVEFAAS